MKGKKVYELANDKRIKMKKNAYQLGDHGACAAHVRQENDRRVNLISDVVMDST